MIRFVQGILVTFLLIFMLAVFGFKLVDRQCTEGRLSHAQVECINSSSWAKCPNYRNGKCEAEYRDRVVNWRCSRFMRELLLREYFGFDWFYRWVDGKGEEDGLR